MVYVNNTRFVKLGYYFLVVCLYLMQSYSRLFNQSRLVREKNMLCPLNCYRGKADWLKRPANKSNKYKGSNIEIIQRFLAHLFNLARFLNLSLTETIKWKRKKNIIRIWCLNKRTKFTQGFEGNSGKMVYQEKCFNHANKTIRFNVHMHII